MPLFREGSPLPVEDRPLGNDECIVLANTDQPETMSLDVDRLSRIVLNFPKYTDGRAYSQARILRGRLGYRGELRATGQVLRDQLPFMLRCGFDSFESEQPGFGPALARARALFSVVYQGAADDRVPAALLRLRPDPDLLAAD